MKLKSITISGFKSFNSDEHTIEFGDITVLIGANGAGKSNVVSFFKMISDMMKYNLQYFIGIQGGAYSVLNYGPKVTPKISAKIVFDFEQINVDYQFSLVHSVQDSLILTETIIYPAEEKFAVKTGYEFPPGKESRLQLDELDPKNDELCLLISNIQPYLKKCSVYQFHDTSLKSGIRNKVYINQNDCLYDDGSNLAAFLYGLKENGKNRLYYNKIVRHIKQIFPQFGDFILKPSIQNDNYIILDWHKKNNIDYRLGAHQLSDGTLRFMALASLLLQPPHNLPPVIVIDEPELGLHPAAIVELAGMVKIASQYTQIILATQNPALLDEFIPEQITVIELDPITKSSIFQKKTTEELAYWLEEYALSEMWDKNILGGRP